jgi:predicted transcriptional regulator
MTARLKFTKEQVLEAYAGEASIEKAAATLGCSVSALTRLMREYGIAAKPKARSGVRRSSIPQLNDRAWMFTQIVELGKTQQEVAAELGTTSGNVAHYVRKHDLYPKAENQSEASKRWYAKRYPDGRKGPQASNWRGGRTKTGSGYWRQYRPDHPAANRNGYVYEHRLVMEEKIGRLLKDGELVDHIDRNRSNNAPENLRLQASRSAHVKDHFSARDQLMALIAKIRGLMRYGYDGEPRDGGAYVSAFELDIVLNEAAA